MRRAEIGHHTTSRGVSGPLRARGSLREDARRVDNGTQVSHVAGLAMACKPSVDFSGYWQRGQK